MMKIGELSVLPQQVEQSAVAAEIQVSNQTPAPGVVLFRPTQVTHQRVDCGSIDQVRVFEIRKPAPQSYNKKRKEKLGNLGLDILIAIAEQPGMQGIARFAEVAVFVHPYLKSALSRYVQPPALKVRQILFYGVEA
jgi:hypothetical protein